MAARLTDPSPAAGRPALAFDLAEWFHAPALAAALSRRHWRRLESRVPVAVHRALAVCADRGALATFFVLGAIADRHPGLVREIARAGHEIASLGWLPGDLGAVPVAERDQELAGLARARAAIEAATGVAVHGFATAWPTAGAPWWRQPLALAGYAYDASTPAGDSAPFEALAAGLAPTAPGPVRVRRFAAAALDAAEPRLVGLPARVLRRHRDALRRTAAALEDALAHAGGRPIAAAFGLAAVAAPPRPNAANAAVGDAPAVPCKDLPRLAVVVPLKDEAAGLPSLMQELDTIATQLQAVAACEFVFVDDGSTDPTWAGLQQLAARPDVTLVRHASNQGVAAAIRSGMLATDAPLVASIDGDLSYDPSELARMVPLLAGAEVVTASPYHPAGGVKNVPGWRLLLSRTLSACYRRLLRSDLHTWTSCCRVYRRAAVVGLPLDNKGFLGTAELLVRVLRRGGVVREHPCVLEARLFGVSKMKVLRTIRGHLRLLWHVARSRIR